MSRQQNYHRKRRSDGGNRGGGPDSKRVSMGSNDQNAGCRTSELTNRARRWQNRNFRGGDPNKNPRDKGPGYGKEFFGETEYYLENNLRKVIPYSFTFTSYVKERWYGRTVLEVFTDEFRYMTKDEYQQVLDAGHVTVNGRPIRSNFVLAHNDVIEHTIHRHENPVTSAPIEVIENNDDVLVVIKPSSIPVHPCGHYRHNSLVFIVGKELGEFNLRTIYRLDRLTSGVIVFGKSQKRSLELESHVRGRKVQKTYLARVEGDFPSGSLECSKPVDSLSQKLGIMKVSDKGRESHTTFEKISFNGKTSVVKCKPGTGRTHQIRVHLQYLGFPIVNDPLYNSEVWGKDKGKAGNYYKTEHQLIEDIGKLHDRDMFDMDLRQEGWGTCQPPLDERGPVTQAEENDKEGEEKTEKKDGEKEEKPETTTNGDSEIKFTYNPDDVETMGPLSKEEVLKKLEDCTDPMCKDCKRRFRDPRPDELIMYLHAISYKGPDWEYSAPEPDWAKEDWVDPAGIAS